MKTYKTLNGYTFEVVKAGSKKASAIIERVENSEFLTLRDCYGRYSYAKERAYNAIRSFAHEIGAGFCTITGYNCNAFSMGVIRQTANAYEYYYFTSHNQYCVIMQK